MADKLVTLYGPSGHVPVLYHDNGDGTYSPDIHASAVAMTRMQGAANVVSTQVTTSTSAATLVVARPTRRSVTFRNLDASISVYVGPATVTALNGMLLRAGESINVTAVVLWQVIAVSGTPIVACTDEYD